MASRRVSRPIPRRSSAACSCAWVSRAVASASPRSTSARRSWSRSSCRSTRGGIVAYKRRRTVAACCLRSASAGRGSGVAMSLASTPPCCARAWPQRPAAGHKPRGWGCGRGGAVRCCGRCRGGQPGTGGCCRGRGTSPRSPIPGRGCPSRAPTRTFQGRDVVFNRPLRGLPAGSFGGSGSVAALMLPWCVSGARNWSRDVGWRGDLLWRPWIAR